MRKLALVLLFAACAKQEQPAAQQQPAPYFACGMDMMKGTVVVQ